jgi:hypothetical protein
MAVDNKRLILVRLPSWRGRNLRPQDYRRAFGSVECALYALHDGKLVGPLLSLGHEDGYFGHTTWPYAVRR